MKKDEYWWINEWKRWILLKKWMKKMNIGEEMNDKRLILLKKWMK